MPNLKKVLAQLSRRHAAGELILCSLPPVAELKRRDELPLIEVDVSEARAAWLRKHDEEPLAVQGCLVRGKWMSFIVWTVQLHEWQMRVTVPVVGAQTLRVLELLRNSRELMTCGFSYETYPLTAADLSHAQDVVPTAMQEHRMPTGDDVYNLLALTLAFCLELFKVDLPVEPNPYGEATNIEVAVLLPDEFTDGIQSLLVETSCDLLQRFRLPVAGH